MTEVECTMPYIDIQKPTTRRWNIMIQAKNLHISYTGMSTTCVDEQCTKSNSQMVSNGETISLASAMSSYKAMMNTATKEASLKLMLFILRNYKRHTSGYHSYPKKWTLISVRNRWAICITRQFLIHVKVLKQKMDVGVILKKTHRVIESSIQNSEQKSNMILRRTSSKWSSNQCLEDYRECKEDFRLVTRRNHQIERRLWGSFRRYWNKIWNT